MLATCRIVVATVNSEKFEVIEEVLAPFRDLALARADSVIRNPEKLRFAVDWRPILIPQGEYRTLAEMSKEDRARYSPRDRAIEQVMKEMAEDGLTLVKPQAG